jgi:cytochrome c oxidase cbb3-type subunit 3
MNASKSAPRAPRTGLEANRGAPRRVERRHLKNRSIWLAAALLPLAWPQLAAAEGDADRGESIYRVLCTQCHGVDGNGYGVNTRDMAVLPRDHTDTGEMSARTDADLFKAIQGGGPAVNKSVLMPAWEGNLEDQAIEDVVAYLRKLCCSDKE